MLSIFFSHSPFIVSLKKNINYISKKTKTKNCKYVKTRKNISCLITNSLKWKCGLEGLLYKYQSENLTVRTEISYIWWTKVFLVRIFSNSYSLHYLYMNHQIICFNMHVTVSQEHVGERYLLNAWSKFKKGHNSTLLFCDYSFYFIYITSPWFHMRNILPLLLFYFRNRLLTVYFVGWFSFAHLVRGESLLVS